MLPWYVVPLHKVPEELGADAGVCSDPELSSHLSGGPAKLHRRGSTSTELVARCKLNCGHTAAMQVYAHTAMARLRKRDERILNAEDA